jgi:type IV pilus biogenesis protein CpaD/CtpE
MDGCDFIGRISLGLVCALALVAGCLTNEGRERIARSRVVDEAEATATIRFAEGESEPAAHLPAYVDELVEGAASGSSKAVLVLGFANDHDDLNTNLALAERRAQAIARELVTRGVPRDRMIVAGSETRPNEEGGSRVEVTIVPRSRLAMRPANAPADR